MDYQICVRMNKADLKHLEGLARRRGTSVSELIRELIRNTELVTVQQTVMQARSRLAA